jgi:hypothetical protein
MDKDPMHPMQTAIENQPKPDPRALKILAKSIFKQLRAQGYEPKQILGLATEIVSLVSTGIAQDNDSQR